MAQYPDFDLDRSISQAWDEFELRLAEVISVIDDTADFTIDGVATDDGAVPYVTFTAVSRTVLRARAAGNGVLGEDYQLGPDQVARLLEAGWLLPEGYTAETAPSFHMEMDQEASDHMAHATVVALRDAYGVQHPVFLSPDHLAEVLTPHPEPLAADQVFDDDAMTARTPASAAHLDEMVEAELTQIFGHAPFRDADGDIALRVGSAMVFLRTSHDHRELVVFSAIVHDVAGRSRATEVINDLNTEARMVKFHLQRDRVFVSLSVLTHPFVPAHLHQALRLMSELADGIDEELARKLHGRTTYE